MRFYTQKHDHTCGIDLHGRSLYLCVLDREGEKLLHRRIPCDPERLLALLAPFREDLVIGVECMFSWYWVADLCADEGIPFVLGHALEMKAVHGAKTGNDRLDSERIARLLLRTIPGVDEILAATVLYEIHHVDRFAKVGEFLSYSRLVKCFKTSVGKIKGVGGSKRGNVHLKWAFSEAAALFLRANPVGQKLHDRLVRKHGKAKAMGILAAKLARAAFFMLKRRQPFDLALFARS